MRPLSRKLNLSCDLVEFYEATKKPEIDVEVSGCLGSMGEMSERCQNVVELECQPVLANVTRYVLIPLCLVADLCQTGT